MSQHSGKASGLIDPHAFDVFEFARSGRQAAGAVRLSQLPRMLNEVPAGAPDRDTLFTWQAEGSTQPELQDDGTEAAQHYLRLALHGRRGSNVSAASRLTSSRSTSRRRTESWRPKRKPRNSPSTRKSSM